LSTFGGDVDLDRVLVHRHEYFGVTVVFVYIVCLIVLIC